MAKKKRSKRKSHAGMVKVCRWVRVKVKKRSRRRKKK